MTAALAAALAAAGTETESHYTALLALAETVRAHLAAAPEIYVALNDHGDRGTSFVTGAFSSEELARDACQEDAAAAELAWNDGEAPDDDGSSYAVVLVNLDVAT